MSKLLSAVLPDELADRDKSEAPELFRSRLMFEFFAGRMLSGFFYVLFYNPIADIYL